MRTIIALCGALAVTASTALAQTNDCTTTGSISIDAVVKAAQTVCQNKNKGKRAAAGRKFAKGARFLDEGIGDEGADFMKFLINKLFRKAKNKKNRCRLPTDTPACGNATSYTVAEIRANLEAGACTKKTKSARQAALKRFKRGLKNLKNLLDQTIYSTLIALVDTLKASTDCGQGGNSGGSGTVPSKCKKVVRFKRGDLWKAASDNTGCPVFLIGQFGGVPSSCQILKSDGKKFMTFHSTGPSNGRSGTYRGSCGPSCGSFPKTFYVGCAIAGKGTQCWKVKGPCSRHE